MEKSKRVRILETEPQRQFQDFDELYVDMNDHYVKEDGRIISLSSAHSKSRQFLNLKNYILKGKHQFDNKLVPNTLPEYLKPTQQCTIIDFVARLKGRGIICIKAGGGKTLTSIVLSGIYGLKTLFVTPPAKKRDFIQECMKWTGEVMVDVKSPKDIDDFCTNRLFIISVHTGKFHPSIFQMSWGMVVIDEAHALNGEDTLISNAWREACHNATYVALLTASPLTKHHEQVFNMLNCVNPYVFPDRHVFRSRYSCVEEDPRGRVFVIGNKRENEFGCMFKLFRSDGKQNDGPRNDESLAELKIENDYGKLTRKFVYVDNTPELPKMGDIPKCNPGSMMGKAALQATVRKFKFEKCKLLTPIVLEMVLKQNTGTGTLIFVDGLEQQDYLVCALKDKVNRVEKINGKITKKKREQIFADAASGKIDALIATFRTSAEGINLVPSITQLLILDIPWSWSDITQGESRIHRQGQKHSVNSYIFIVRNSDIDNMLISRCRGNIAFTVNALNGCGYS